MKKAFCFSITYSLLQVMNITPTHAQLKPRINFDLSFFHYGAEAGLGKDKIYNNKFQVCSAAKLGFALDENNVIHGSLRREPNELAVAKSFNPADDTEEFSENGFEACLGYERKLRLSSWLYLFGELGFFYDYARIGGSVMHHYYEEQVNHKRYYTGIYSGLKTGFKLSSHIYILAGTRLRLGKVRTSFVPNIPDPHPPAYQAVNGFAITYDPLSELGFRYQL